MTDFCLASRDTRLDEDKYDGNQTKQRREPVIIHYIILAQFLKEFFVVGDNNELEIRMCLAFIDNAIRCVNKVAASWENPYLLYKAGCECINVLRIKSVGGFVQGEDTTILAERIRKCQSYNNRCQHFLTRWTSATHVHFDLIFRHDHLTDNRHGRIGP